MRLSQEQKGVITEAISSFDPDAEVFLFGSRVDDNKRGGDIDLLVKSKLIGLNERRSIKLKLMDRLGPQKIDIILPSDKNNALVSIAESEGIKL